MTTTRRVLALALFSVVATLTSLAVTVSPAGAVTGCRTPYVTAAWNVVTCVGNEGKICPPKGCYNTVGAWSNIYVRHRNCVTVRTYIVDLNNEEALSTSARSCADTYPRGITVWDGEFGGLPIKARFVAYNGSGEPILSIDSPTIPSYGD